MPNLKVTHNFSEKFLAWDVNLLACSLLVQKTGDGKQRIAYLLPEICVLSIDSNPTLFLTQWKCLNLDKK